MDRTRSNWQNPSARPIVWSAWYPTHDTSTDESSSGGFFDLGGVIGNASLSQAGKFPVVLMSHGTGGIAESLGWLARALVNEGYIVIGANHHGNSGNEPYMAEGFLCWWERATDLSVLLTSIATNGFLADRLDLQHVTAIGFSLGGHTVLALAGGHTSMDVFEGWHRANNIPSGGPREFPDAADSIPDLLDTSQAFRASWARHDDEFTDTRISRVVAIAPAPPVRAFTAASIGQIDLPVTILTGGADAEAPAVQCANWLMRQNLGFQHHELGRQVGHYTFLEHPSDKGLMGKLDIFTDHETVDRKQIHGLATQIVIDALRAG